VRLSATGGDDPDPVRPYLGPVATDRADEIVEHLFALVERLRAGFEEAVSCFELSAAQAKALRYLTWAGPVPMRELADRLRCDVSNVTGLVDRLEQRGLVERRPAPSDRRVKTLVVVTTAGAEVAQAMWARVVTGALHQFLCLSLGLWNGVDPIMKERAFGLSGPEGNHGEDAKDYWFFLDSTPTHSFMRWRYLYPQAAFPYEDLVAENRRRGEGRSRGSVRAHRGPQPRGHDGRRLLSVVSPTLSEHFHGETGAGLGASHQTGWTGLIIDLLLGLPVSRMA